LKHKIKNTFSDLSEQVMGVQIWLKDKLIFVLFSLIYFKINQCHFKMKCEKKVVIISITGFKNSVALA